MDDHLLHHVAYLVEHHIAFQSISEAYYLDYQPDHSLMDQMYIEPQKLLHYLLD